MKKSGRADPTARLEAELSRGPATAKELASALGLSQPSFSRLAKANAARLLVTGSARSTRYALRRTVHGAGSSVPLYEIDDSGEARKLATLHAVVPGGFYVEALEPEVTSAFHHDLPYFLNELRPAGFLGRLIPRRHPELELPSDILLWSADHCLEYLSRYGWNQSGNLIVGDEAFRLYLAMSDASEGAISDAARPESYAELASDVLRGGPPGSSAGGEQPKFLALRARGPKHVLAKFSPPLRDETTRRMADLLVAEHLSLETMREGGMDAAHSELVTAGERVFLEVERFDRVGKHGRRGLLSLLALDAEFVGHLRNWSDSAERLHEQGRIDDATLNEIRRRELYNRLIANSDMHAGNLSFFMRGAQALGLAPAYDVGPSLYVPRQGDITPPPFEPKTPSPADAEIWLEVHAAAAVFWKKLAKERRVSPDFRAVARENLGALEDWHRLASRLPRHTRARAGGR